MVPSAAAYQASPSLHPSSLKPRPLSDPSLSDPFSVGPRPLSATRSAPPRTGGLRRETRPTAAPRPRQRSCGGGGRARVAERSGGGATDQEQCRELRRWEGG